MNTNVKRPSGNLTVTTRQPFPLSGQLYKLLGEMSAKSAIFTVFASYPISWDKLNIAGGSSVQ